MVGLVLLGFKSIRRVATIDKGNECRYHVLCMDARDRDGRDVLVFWLDLDDASVLGGTYRLV